MTRRDRAALVLALECLRKYGGDHAHEGFCEAMDCGRMADPFWESFAFQVLNAANTAPPVESVSWKLGARLLRARLALLLRALLRADAGDFGDGWRCVRCREVWCDFPGERACECAATGYVGYTWGPRRHRPLWQLTRKVVE